MCAPYQGVYGGLRRALGGKFEISDAVHASMLVATRSQDISATRSPCRTRKGLAWTHARKRSAMKRFIIMSTIRAQQVCQARTYLRLQREHCNTPCHCATLWHPTKCPLRYNALFQITCLHSNASAHTRAGARTMTSPVSRLHNAEQHQVEESLHCAEKAMSRMCGSP